MKLIRWDSASVAGEEIEAAISSLKHGFDSPGPNVVRAEQEFQARIGCSDAILVCNGTAALLTLLFAIKEKYPDVARIAVPSFTFIASYNAVKTVFPEIRLVDCDLETWNVTPEYILEKVDLVLLVDVGGQPSIYDSFPQSDYLIIADSAESLGSTLDEREIGSQLMGHTFSFQRSKIISCGEGGMITLQDRELANICRSIMNHGYSSNKRFHEYKYDRFGLNFRMNDVQAAILISQLQKLDRFIARRRQIAAWYEGALNSKFGLQKMDSRVSSNRFFFGILLDSPNQAKFADHMQGLGIMVKAWTSVTKSLKEVNQLKNSGFLSERNILLPIHNDLTDPEVERVIEACLSF